MNRPSIFLIILAATSALCLYCSKDDNPFSSGSGTWNLVTLTDKQLDQTFRNNHRLEPGFTTFASGVGFLIVGVDAALEITATRFNLSIAVDATTGGNAVYDNEINSAGPYAMDDNTITVTTDDQETATFSFSLDGNRLICIS